MPANSGAVAKVITVLGPRDVREMGHTDAHNHLWIERVPGSARQDAPILDDEQAILVELHEFRRAGGGGQIDCQPSGCGRDGRRLVSLAQESGLHIVASTGFHRQRYYPQEARLFSFSVQAAAGYFMDEIRFGLVETRSLPAPVFPGQIKIAVEASLEASPRALLEGAAAACRESGLALHMHTEKGASVEAFLKFFLAQGVSAGRLVFAHVDKRPDFNLHDELAREGVMLEYDTFFRPKYEPEKHVWPLLERMLAADLAGQVALATDMAERTLWKKGGGPGPAAFLTHIKTRLERQGVPAELTTNLLGAAITRRLAVHVKEQIQ